MTHDPAAAVGPASAPPLPPQLKVPTAAASTAAVALLKLEDNLRQTRSRQELAYFLANEVRTLTRAQQIVVMSRTAGGGFSVDAVTAVTMVDRSVPMIGWLEAVIDALGRKHGLAKPHEFEASAFATEAGSYGAGYPLRNLLWIPILDLDGKVMGGMLQARTQPWTEPEIAIGKHLAGAAAHTGLALDQRGKGWTRRIGLSRRAAVLATVALAAASCLPVSMSALAPVEVTSRDAFIVTAGVDGVVESVAVDPNASVANGVVLVRIADTVLRNRLEVAEREVAVAHSKHKKAAQLAFVDMRGRQDLALAQAELELKLTELDFAREMLARTEIKADREGVAFYSDRKDLIGRPVAAGEKLMEVADPKAVRFRIDLPVAEAIVLGEGARVKVFLDSDPLWPIEARVVRTDYQARVRDGQPLAFRLVAEGTAPLPATARLGVRGTAQVYGDRVALVYFLLRRPIAAVRQWSGI